MDKILVTGATGFVGSVLCRKLLERGYEVWGIGRKEYGFLEEEVIEHWNFKFFKCDPTKEVPQIDENFDGIFHLASTLPRRNAEFLNYYLTEIKFFSFLKRIKSSFVCYSSTCSVYGLNRGIISEETPVFIKSHYANAKLLGENLIIISSFPQKVVFRFPIITGKHDQRSVVNIYYYLAKSSKPIEVFSRGERLRNIIHVDDAAEVMIRAYESREKLSSYELFVAGSKESLKMKEIAEIIKRLTGSSSKIILSEKTPPTDWDVVIDISKLVRKLNFVPMTTKEAIEKYVREMEEL